MCFVGWQMAKKVKQIYLNDYRIITFGQKKVKTDE
jgi:hypothetical protein